MPEENFTPEYKLDEYTPENSNLDELNISKDKNFDTWLNIIKHIIYYLKNLDKDIKNPNNGIQQAIEDAEERNQITECINSIAIDCDECVSNGIYYVKYANDTSHTPTNSDYILYVSKLCENIDDNNAEKLIQFAIRINTITNDSKISSSPEIFYVRVGTPSGNTHNFTEWYVHATTEWVQTNFLNKVQTQTQHVNSGVIFDSNNAVQVRGGRFIAKKNSLFNGFVDIVNTYSTETDSEKGVRLNHTNDKNNFSIEIINNTGTSDSPNTIIVDETPNVPIYPQYGDINNKIYQEPLVISYETGLCNINGTANYANFINPDNTISTFDPNNLNEYSENYPATAKAVADLYSYSEKTYMQKSGGNFDGIVNHSEDIFLRYIKNMNTNRTAAIRSPDGELNLQCKQITNIISTAKQAELYLEKEDVDSAEYTKKTSAFSFNFYTVVWNLAKIVGNNPELNVTYTKNNDIVYVYTEIGEFQLESDGGYIFIGNSKLKRDIDRNISYKFTLYYDIQNKFNANPNSISQNNDHEIIISKKTGSSFRGNITVNASHYKIVFTKPNFDYLPVIAPSTIRGTATLDSSSVLADGSLIAAGSIVNGIRYDKDETVKGIKICPATKLDENNNPVNIETTLYNGSILRKGTCLMFGSILNGMTIQQEYRILESDILIISKEPSEEDESLLKINTKLTVGSTIKSGSVIAPRSVVNGIVYLSEITVEGMPINVLVGEDSILAPGSRIAIGSKISLNSVINDSIDDTHGIQIKFGSTIKEGSTLSAGTLVAAGSTINNEYYSNPIHIPNSLHIIYDSTLAPESFIKSYSIITKNSIINNVSISQTYTVISEVYTGEITSSMLAPKMYIGVYDNIKDTHTSWIEYSYSKYYPNNIEYDKSIWKYRIEEIINKLPITDIKTEIFNDLDTILDDNPSISYPEIVNLNSILYVGKYTASKNAANNPQNVYDEYVYIAKTERELKLDKIGFEVIKSNGLRTEFIIYNTNETDTITIEPTTDVFKYSNFVVHKMGSTYKVTFDYMLANELNQYDTNVQIFSERIRFNFYGASLSIPFSTEEHMISFDAKHMMNSASVFGARTRTGITLEGEFGDPLYDLGCVEFGEDYTAIRLRKRNVTTLQNIKSDIAVVLERNAFKPQYTEYVNTTNGTISKVFDMEDKYTFEINSIEYYIDRDKIKQVDDVSVKIKLGKVFKIGSTIYIISKLEENELENNSDEEYDLDKEYVINVSNNSKYEISSSNYFKIDNIIYHIENDIVTDMENTYPLYNNAFVINNEIYRNYNNIIENVSNEIQYPITNNNFKLGEDDNAVTYTINDDYTYVIDSTETYSINAYNQFTIGTGSNAKTYTILPYSYVSNGIPIIIKKYCVIEGSSYVIDLKANKVIISNNNYALITNNSFTLSNGRITYFIYPQENYVLDSTDTIKITDNVFIINDILYTIYYDIVSYVNSNNIRVIVPISNNRFKIGDITYKINSNIINYAVPENKSGMISLGTADSKFDTLYVTTATIETSDKTQKTNIKDIPAKLLDAWKDVKWVTYKLKDSVERKGKKARTHTGVIAQDLEKSLSKIDLKKYGFFCKDTWDDEYESKYVTVPKHKDSLGIERDEYIQEIKTLIKSKGEQYSIRYQEMQAIENMYLRREIELLKAEIQELKKKIK